MSQDTDTKNDTKPPNPQTPGLSSAEISEAARRLGSITTPRKQAASRENGKKSQGRKNPWKPLLDYPCTCGRGNVLDTSHPTTCKRGLAIRRRIAKGVPLE